MRPSGARVNPRLARVHAGKLLAGRQPRHAPASCAGTPHARPRQDEGSVKRLHPSGAGIVSEGDTLSVEFRGEMTSPRRA